MSAAKGTRPVPTSLDSWPGVTDLVISYKFMLYVLWSSPSNIVSVIGVGHPGIIERLCSSARLDEPVVLEAMRELDRRGLVVLDEATREIAIRRWCAFHNFSGKWAGIAANAYDEIDSAKIKGVLAKSEGVKGLFPTNSTPPPPNSNSNSNSSSNNNKEPSKRGAARPSSLDEEDDSDQQTPKPAGKKGAARPAPVGDDVTYQVTSQGIVYQAGNARDLGNLSTISTHSPNSVQVAVLRAAAQDDRGRAFSSKVLRELLRSSSPQSAERFSWANAGIDPDEQPGVAAPGCYETTFEVTANDAA